MKTLSAMRNGWRCPQCGDQTTTDKARRGFVRHLRNPSCNFERGEKDDDWHGVKLEIKREDTHRNRMQVAVIEVVKELQNNPDWSSYIRWKLRYTLTGEYADNDVSVKLPDDLEDQRALVYEYMTLALTIEQIQTCEYYLRRFPFRDLPIERGAHILNVCELYFSKCYQFKGRLKNYLNSLKRYATNFDVKGFVKAYVRLFDRELKARNDVHHREFSDRTIELVHLHDKLDIGKRNYQYRVTTGYWIKEIQRTVLTLEGIVDVLAQRTFENVPSLSKYNKPVDEVHITLERVPENVT